MTKHANVKKTLTKKTHHGHGVSSYFAIVSDLLNKLLNKTCILYIATFFSKLVS